MHRAAGAARMLAIIWAGLVWVAVVGLPGYLICDALRRGAGRARNLALAPAAGLGAVFLVAHVIQVCGLPVTAAIAVPVCISGSAAVWLGVRRPSLADLRAWRPRLPAMFDRVSLLLALVLGGGIWLVSIRDPAILPNTDGVHHALLVSRIQSLHSVDPARIWSPDGVSRGSYYPLALHIGAAFVSSLAGVSPGTALTAALLLAASVVRPVGIFVLVRRLDPRTRTVAGVAAVITVLFAWFPYSPMVWGGLPTVTGMCLIPAVVDGLWPSRHGGARVAVGVCAGIAAVGIFQTHNPQLIAAAATAFVLVTANGGLRGMARRVTVAVWAVSAAVVMVGSLSTWVAVFGPNSSFNPVSWQRQSGSAAGQPTAFFSASGGQLADQILSPPILVLGVVGLAICVLDKRCRGVGVLFLMWTAFAVAVALRLRPFVLLATPWYQAPMRLSYYLALPLVIWAAVAVAKLGGGLAAVVSRVIPTWRSRVGAGAGAGALLLLVAALQMPPAVAMTQGIYRRAVLVGPDQLAAFRWLHVHVAAGDRVLDAFDDGSGWMGVLGFAEPVFATKPEQGGEQVWGDRWHLLTDAGALARDPVDQRAVRTWHIQYASTDSRNFPGTPPLPFTARTLQGSSAYRLVWQRGPVEIFRVEVTQP